jgi:arginine-tRNA-protein transferase
MQYKVRFRPLERLTRSGWERISDEEQTRLIASATASRSKERGADRLQARACKDAVPADGAESARYDFVG